MQILRDEDVKGLMTAAKGRTITEVKLADEEQCCGIMVKLSVDSQWKVTVDTSGGYDVKEHYKPDRHCGRDANTGEPPPSAATRPLSSSCCERTLIRARRGIGMPGISEIGPLPHCSGCLRSLRSWRELLVHADCAREQRGRYRLRGRGHASEAVGEGATWSQNEHQTEVLPPCADFSGLVFS